MQWCSGVTPQGVFFLATVLCVCPADIELVIGLHISLALHNLWLQVFLWRTVLSLKQHFEAVWAEGKRLGMVSYIAVFLSIPARLISSCGTGELCMWGSQVCSLTLHVSLSTGREAKISWKRLILAKGKKL